MLCRLRMGAGKSKAIGWMAETMAPLSVAAMGARLLGLDEREMLDAVGLAYALWSGNVQPTVEGAWSLWVPAGTAAAGGILAIDLARAGFVGPRNPLLGEFGLYRLYFRGDYDEAAAARASSGDRNEIVNNKPEALSRPASTRITRSATTLEAGPGARPQAGADARRVTVATNDDGRHPVRLRRERARRRRLRRRRGRRSSAYPFTVATAIVRRRVTLEDFTEDAIRDPELLGAGARKVTTRVDPVPRMRLPMLYPPADVQDRDRGRAGRSRVRGLREGPPQEAVHAGRLRRALHVLRRLAPRKPLGPASAATLRQDGAKPGAREGRGRDGAACWRETAVAPDRRPRDERAGADRLHRPRRSWASRMAGTLARAGHA